MKKNNGIIVFQFLVNVSSLIAFVFQLAPLPPKYSWLTNGLIWIVLVLVIISLTISIVSRNKFSRRRLTNLTKKLMRNAKASVTMFGGDLSWTADYTDIIRQITANGKTVEIVFPKTKIESMSEAARGQFKKNVNELNKAGAEVFYTEQEHTLRCTIIDVHALELKSVGDHEDLKIIVSKRVHAHKSDERKNKYRVNCFSIKKEYEKWLCMLYCKYYNELRAQMIEYK